MKLGALVKVDVDRFLVIFSESIEVICEGHLVSRPLWLSFPHSPSHNLGPVRLTYLDHPMTSSREKLWDRCLERRDDDALAHGLKLDLG